MIEDPERFSENGLRETLRLYALGKKIYYFHTIDSTNNFAKKLASEGAEEGTLIISEGQIQGRGRLGRKWLSPPGTGILMSLILRPELQPSEAAKVTFIAAVSVATAIHKVTGLAALIKWPNDIVIHHKKTCGILTELGSDLNGSNYIVVGIGINVNINKFPEEIKDRATSLMKCLGQKVDRMKVLSQTIDELEKLYFDFIKTNSFAQTLSAYRKKSVTIGKRVKVIIKDRDFSADAIDVTKSGGLLVKKDDGEIVEINSGEVSLRDIE